ncbi:MAG: hypothetical protein ACK4XJ_11890 [Fimbriimonadaceae bacterium]
MLLSAVAGAVVLQSGGVTLALKPPTGRSVNFAQTGRIDRKAGSSSPTFMEYTVKFGLQRAPGSAVTLVETIREAGIFPSANTEGGEDIPKLAKGMQGLQLTSTYDASGFASNRKASGGGPGAFDLYQMTIGEPLGFYGLVFPGRAISKDSSWRSRIDLTQAARAAAPPGATTTVGNPIPVTYRMVASSGGRVTIESITKGSTVVTYRSTDSDGKPVRQSMTISIDGKSTLIFEVSTGLPVKVETQSTSSTRAGDRVTEIKTKSTLTREG